MTTTAWGNATVLEEVSIAQSAGAGDAKKEFATLVELLESSAGETLVRFSYSTDGTARRGPVTLRPADMVKLRKALAKTPRLRAALAASLT